MKSISRNEYKIRFVMEKTGCTRETAIANLIAEEWDADDAIIDIRAEQ